MVGWALITVAVLLLGACSDDDSSETDAEPLAFVCKTDAIPKGNRALGMDILDTAEAGTFDESLAAAQAMGVSFLDLHMDWITLEAAPEMIVDPGETLATFRALLDAHRGLKLSLTLRPLDLAGKRVPNDLETVRFNDPLMVSRFKTLIDFVLATVPPERLTSLQIGNEIDGYDSSSEGPEFWSDYGAFLAAMNAHVDANYPGLKVGFTGTYAMTQAPLKDSGVFTALADAVDVVGVTYYPNNADFTPKAPGVVEADFAQIVSAFEGHPVLVQEIGYHTPMNSAESEQAQAEFYCNTFKAWDAHPEIQSMIVVRQHDTSQEDALALAKPYGIDDAQFIEFLRSLGIRRVDGKGSDKPAAVVIREQARARGF